MPPQKSSFQKLVEKLCREQWPLQLDVRGPGRPGRPRPMPTLGDKTLFLHSKLRADQRVIQAFRESKKGQKIPALLPETHSTIRKKCKLYTAIQSTLVRQSWAQSPSTLRRRADAERQKADGRRQYYKEQFVQQVEIRVHRILRAVRRVEFNRVHSSQFLEELDSVVHAAECMLNSGRAENIVGNASPLFDDGHAYDNGLDHPSSHDEASDLSVPDSDEDSVTTNTDLNKSLINECRTRLQREAVEALLQATT